MTDNVEDLNRFVARERGDGERIESGLRRTGIEIKAAAPETHGKFSLLETTSAPDSGPPLHVHRTADEAFYVLDGAYEFWCGERHVAGGPGTFVLLPHGVPHRYRAGPDGGRMLMLFAPGGTEAYFRELTVAIEGGADDAALGALAEHHGIDLLDTYRRT